MSWVYVVATVVAAMLIGFGFVLQQYAAQQVRTAEFLRLGLIGKLVHNRRWLGGIAALVAGDLLGAWTLGHLTLSITEPLLTTNLIFALVLAVPLSGQTLRRTEIAGALLLTAGVAALSATRTVRGPGESFGSVSHWPAAALIALIAAILVSLGRRRSGVMRAALTGTACGLVFGIADALTRTSVLMLDGQNPIHLLTTWPGYATLATSLVGLWLMQNAFNAAPLHASLPAVTAAEPVAGMALGVVVFGDVVHVSPWLLSVQAASIAAMVSGVILVARAPVFRDLHLRELPHVALERLQHPVHHVAAASQSDRPPADASEERLLSPDGPRVPEGQAGAPGGRARMPEGQARVPHGKARVPRRKSLVRGRKPRVSGTQPLVNGTQPLANGGQTLANGGQPLVPGAHPLVPGGKQPEG
jgi:drug/metabolite transporter (DMT)-like permease